MADEQQPQLTANQLATLSVLTERALMASRAGISFDGARDMYTVLGYKRTLTYDDYYARYERQDIAARIVNAAPNATWRKAPDVTEDERPEQKTEFETQWEALVTQLSIYEYLCRVDRLAGIGRYAVLLIGVNDGKALETPLDKDSLKGPEDVLYLAPYSEKSAVIHSLVTKADDTHFGKPEFYSIDLLGELKNSVSTANMSQKVHWSRVLHVAEGLLEDDIYGIPRLRGVYNLLDDLMKVVGGSAEMYWVEARAGMAFKSETVPANPADTQDKIDEFYHGLRRYLLLQNMEVEKLNSQIPRPAENFDVILSLISGTTGIPKRILTGSEQAQLASAQDETNWNARVVERMTTHAEPHLLRALIDRLILIGALTAPTQPYTVTWPNLFEMGENEQADVGLKKTQALVGYANAIGIELLVPPSEFRREIMHLPDESTPEDKATIIEDPLPANDPNVQAQFARRAA